jgi:hypothetical protein
MTSPSKWWFSNEVRRRIGMINIRKLAAVDMAWLGTRVIVAEYAIGVALPLVLGVLSIRSGLLGPARSGWEAALGFWLIGIAANYVPLLIYSLLIARAGSAKQEGQPELAHARRYGLQQVILLVPFFVVVLALVQEMKHR